MQQPFEGRAERIVRRLLLDSERTWKTRDLATAAEVSVGLVSMTTTTLAREQLLAKSRAGICLTQSERLLDNWSQAYDLGRSAMRIYRSLEDIPALTQRLSRLHENLGERYGLTLWSGARLLLPDAKPPTHLALYWQGDPQELARVLHLSENVGHSYVFCFTPYDEGLLWGSAATEDHLRVVHPLQLYLDLAAGDDNELQLAGLVRSRLLNPQPEN